MYSQKDSRWANLPINGQTSYLMKDYGCLICCLAEIAGVEPTVALKQLQFNVAEVVWGSIGNIGLELIENAPYDNAKVLDYIAKNGQCIVRVDWDGNPQTLKDTHFVIYRGNKVLSDPNDGKDKPTTSYPVVTGLRAVKKVASPLTACLNDREKFWQERDQARNLLTSIANYLGLSGEPWTTPAEGYTSVIGGYKARVTDLQNQLATANAEVANRIEQISRLEGEFATKEKLQKAEYDVLKTQYNELDKSIPLYKGQIATLNGSVETLAKEKGALQIELALAKAQFKSLNFMQRLKLLFS